MVKKEGGLIAGHAVGLEELLRRPPLSQCYNQFMGFVLSRVGCVRNETKCGTCTFYAGNFVDLGCRAFEAQDGIHRRLKCKNSSHDK